MTQTDTTPILYDTPHTLLPQNEPIGTFHSFQGDPQGEAIDYIFTTSEWQAHAAQIIRYHESGRYPSDHFPVLLEASLV